MTPLNFYAVIPARYASTRLPGKPLLDIAGKPMVVHVADKAKLAGAAQVVVATDDQRILSAVKAYGYDAVLTRADHVSGTDRIAEVVSNQNWHEDSIVVNVQGDEPLIDPALIIQVAETLANNNEAVMATACHTIHDKQDFLNPNVVKVVLDKMVTHFISVALRFHIPEMRSLRVLTSRNRCLYIDTSASTLTGRNF